MLKGLSINEINLSEINNTEVMRLESEFHTARSFPLKEHFSGVEIIDFSQYGTSKGLNENREGYPVLRLNEFDSAFIKEPEKFCNIINEKTFQSLKLKQNDVLICRTNGNPNFVGKSALVPKEYEFAYASYLFKIRPKEKLINSATLVAYLNSKYGRIEIEKFSMASNQVNFSPAKFREMRIPSFNEKFNKLIEKITYLAFNNLEESKTLYNQAENILKENLGIQNLQIDNQPTSIKSFKESFLSFGRLDAEYYQPKYEQLINYILSQNHDKLINLVDITKSIEPGSSNYSEEGIPFLRVSDYSKFQLEKPEKNLSLQFYNENKQLINDLKPKKEDILFSKDGTVGIAYMLRNDEELITSSAILHLKVKNKEKIIPQYLMLLLNSELVQKQAERDAGGSIILHWRVDEIENVVIPIIDYTEQKKIASLLDKSFKLRDQSNCLINITKLAVERAIEYDESTAINTTKKVLNSYNLSK
ncbi:restriction endonuclease subunit S [Amphibacillus indicireducens]|uniref:Type I restriction modification DNA specificity domain-containing protein n=1 Tax=Amphibacillus indicireducens TaxID=1076330 RepID=A0ABP7VKC5_9BACI